MLGQVPERKCYLVQRRRKPSEQKLDILGFFPSREDAILAAKIFTKEYLPEENVDFDRLEKVFLLECLMGIFTHPPELEGSRNRAHAFELVIQEYEHTREFDADELLREYMEMRGLVFAPE